MNQHERTDMFFEQMQGPAAETLRQAKEDARNETYEARQVANFLRKAGSKLSMAQMVASAQAATGEPQVTFAWLQQLYPQFPVRLFAQKIRYVHEIAIVDLFRKFTKLSCMRVLQEMVAANNLDLKTRNVGLIFQLPGLGAVVLHNLRRNAQIGDDDSFQDGGTLIVRTVGAPPITYVIEQLSTFIPALGNAWLEQR
jgi:hypothetical protein